MTTRRSRTAEHGLEKRGKPIVLPLLALMIAVGGWFADRQPSTADPETAASNKAVGQGEIAVSAILKGGDANESERQRATTAEHRPDVATGAAHPTNAASLSGIDNGTAVTCFTHPLITLCYRLTQERR